MKNTPANIERIMLKFIEISYSSAEILSPPVVSTKPATSFNDRENINILIIGVKIKLSNAKNIEKPKAFLIIIRLPITISNPSER